VLKFPSSRLAQRLALVVCLLLGVAARAADATKPFGEYQVKAVFLYNFTKFVSWPTNVFNGANAPFVIGVLGADPFGPALDELVSAQSVGSHPISVRRLGRDEPIGGCQILFVARSERERLPDVFAAVKDRPILTVGDMPRFVELGGMFNLALSQRRVVIDVIDNAAARAVGLQVNSKLLDLAREVRNGPGLTAPRPRP